MAKIASKAPRDAPDPARLGDLGDLQLAVMQVLWRRGAASVHEVLAQLPTDPAPAYTTILTVLRNLERRGLVTHDPVPGTRMFQYRPLILAHEACTDRLQELLCRWYDSSPLQLIRHLLLLADLSAEERDEIRQLLEDI